MVEAPVLQVPSSGQVAARTAATIPYAGVDIVGALDVDDFDAALEARIERVRDCSQQAPPPRVCPDLTGLVKVRFVISGTGKVTSATAWESTLDDAEVESRIENALLDCRFPMAGGGGVVIVRYPFDLRPPW
ncbi:MAG: hypothetical protein D6798_09965 [Deltaproteobacteria bacterium]|nr:MAG: hypothetical protein D6798_09965 [Deltaproteobacteria bacterium]